jgi:hypothetical protein
MQFFSNTVLGNPSGSRGEKRSKAAKQGEESTLLGGKSDLLIRFFESEWFDAWIAVT